MNLIDVLPPLIAGFGIAAGLWLARSQARRKHEVRIRQMRESAALLAAHAQAADRFLGTDVAPNALKRVLINYSDAMSDRAAALRIAEWMASQPMNSVRFELEPQDDEISEEMGQMNRNHPDLMGDLAQAIVTITIGSVLRWPESAALVEQVGVQMANSPRDNVALAAKAATLRTGAPFGVRESAAAMA